MLEIAISLIVGFALGYGVREWLLRQSRSQQRRRRPFWRCRSAGRVKGANSARCRTASEQL